MDPNALMVRAVEGIEWVMEDTAEAVEDIAEVVIEVVVVRDIVEDEI